MASRVLHNHEVNYYHDYQHDPFVPAIAVVSAGVSRWGPGDAYSRPTPGVVAVNIVTWGSARFCQRGYDAVLGPGQVTLAHAGFDRVIATGPDGVLHKRYVVIGGRLAEAMLRVTGLAARDSLVPRDPARVTALCRQIYASMGARDATSIDRASMLAYALLHELAQSMVEPLPEALARAVAHIRQNLSGSITLDSICAAAGVSRRTCARLFNGRFGMAPVSFYLHEKMQWARNLLATTSLSVKEIAGRLGYDEPLYFSVQFKRLVGVSPSAFRRSSLQQGSRAS